MDHNVSSSGAQGQAVSGTRHSSSGTGSGSTGEEWTGYQWNIPLDEVFDCNSAPKCCRSCYYKGKGMAKTTKVAIVLGFICTTIVIAALIIRFGLQPVEVVLGVGDQQPILSEDENFSPLLCSQYILKNVAMVQNPVFNPSPPSYSSPHSSSSSSSSVSVGRKPAAPQFDAYILTDKPYLSYREVIYKKEETLSFPSDSYFNYWAFYLNLGAYVTIAACSPGTTNIYVRTIKGKSALDQILGNGPTFYAYHYQFSPCETSVHDSYTFHVTSGPGMYAFVFTISEYGTMEGNKSSTPVMFTVNRPELKFEEWAVFDYCKDVAQCALPVPNKAAAVFLEMKQNASVWPITLRAECAPAIGMYFAFFLGVPLGITAVLLCCGGVLYLCQRSVMRDVENADRLRRAASPNSPTSSSDTGRTFRTTSSQRAPLVDNDVLTAMANVSRQPDMPPLYDDVTLVSSAAADSTSTQRNTVEPLPPSYDSIVT